MTMQNESTPYAAINALLEQLLAGIQTILGNKLVGLYLYGSLVTGDFDAGSSDIDLLAAMSSDIDEREFETLLNMHHDFAAKNKEWDGRIEVAYLSVAALQTFKLHTSKIAIISPGEPFHIKEEGIDWLMNWYVVREKGVTLLGPSPTTLIEPISKEEYLLAVQKYVRWWSDKIEIDYLSMQRPSQAYAILTMCRAFYARKHEELVSKKRAAIWAKEELPEWSSLIQNALLWREAWRDGDAEVDHKATFEETRSFVRFVNGQFSA